MRSRRSYWLGRTACIVAAAALLYTASRGAADADASLPLIAAAFACMGLFAWTWRMTGRTSLVLGLHVLAFAGSLTVLTSAVDTFAPQRLAELADISAREQALLPDMWAGADGS